MNTRGARLGLFWVCSRAFSFVFNNSSALFLKKKACPGTKFSSANPEPRNPAKYVTVNYDYQDLTDRNWLCSQNRTQNAICYQQSSALFRKKRRLREDGAWLEFSLTPERYCSSITPSPSVKSGIRWRPEIGFVPKNRTHHVLCYQ
jgi:hypothetical protein